jgi:predicted esterase
MHPHHLRVSRTARYFLLGEEHAAPRELWVALHGHAQLAARFAGQLSPLDDGTRLIALPEGLSRFYLETTLDGRHGTTVGATWMTREDREAELQDIADYLDTLVATLRAGPAVAATRLVVLGFSQGGAVAARWLLRGRTKADALVLWGIPLPEDITADALAGRLGASPVVLVAGAADPIAPPAVHATALKALEAAGLSATAIAFDGGHRIAAEPLARVVAVLA